MNELSVKEAVPRTMQQKPPRYRWLPTLLEWGLPFLGFLVAIWLATQSRPAPQLILLILLAVISVNFSVPLSGTPFSPIVPVVAVVGLLVVGPTLSLATLAAAFVLAELTRPLWRPLWRNSPMEEIGWGRRALRLLAQLLVLLATIVINTRIGAPVPLQVGAPLPEEQTLLQLTLLAGSYSLVYFIASLLLTWPNASATNRGDNAILLLMIAVFTQPFALFGAITYQAVGLPAFVIFCVGAGAFAIMGWLAWQRHFALNQQLRQFASLNSVGASLRETLNLPTVLQRTYDQVATLIDADDFAITLVQEQGRPHRVFQVRHGRQLEEDGGEPGDLTRWVLDRGRPLELDRENIHFAPRHGLQIPEPRPAAWLGVPLTTGEGIIGAIVLQRYGSEQPFGRWNRELLMAVAGQASAAVENARLYDEMRQLYNQTDEALHQRLRQLQALLNSTSEGVLMLDTSGRIVLVNPPAADLLNRQPELLQDKALDLERAESDLGYAVGELQSLLCDLQQGQHPETRSTVYTIRRSPARDGATMRRFMERNEGPVVADDGQLLGWLIIVRDVTEEQERIEWRTNATRMIVHDLRNPVTTLTSNIDIIEVALAAGNQERIQRHVQQARYGAEEMLDMIDSLMDMTRLEAGQLVLEAEAMRVPPLVGRVLERLRPLADQKQIALSFEMAPDLPAAWADEELLRRIFVNLLDNALKFTPAGGAVTIALKPEPAVDGHEAGMRCTVADNGPGINLAHKDRVFERFTRVNVGGGQVRGTGLGLAFCRLAIEAHGGAIWVEDAPGGGSRFVFTLPGVPHFD